MHDKDATWGSSGVKFIDRVDQIITDISPDSVIDYGCGKNTLINGIRERRPSWIADVTLYDPGIDGLDTPPSKPAHMVICTDVLEHIEPEHLDAVMKHIADLTEKVAYFIIFTGDCGHRLHDGRPAHLIQEDMGWWQGKFFEHFSERGFNFIMQKIDGHRFEVICTHAECGIYDEIMDPEPDMTEIEALETARKIDMPAGGFGIGNINHKLKDE